MQKYNLSLGGSNTFVFFNRESILDNHSKFQNPNLTKLFFAFGVNWPLLVDFLNLFLMIIIFLVVFPDFVIRDKHLVAGWAFFNFFRLFQQIWIFGYNFQNFGSIIQNFCFLRARRKLILQGSFLQQFLCRDRF